MSGEEEPTFKLVSTGIRFHILCVMHSPLLDLASIISLEDSFPFEVANEAQETEIEVVVKSFDGISQAVTEATNALKLCIYNVQTAANMYNEAGNMYASTKPFNDSSPLAT